MIHIEASVPLPFDESLLERAAEAALKHQSAHGDLSLVMTDDNIMRQMNKDYRGIDSSTDVLSFPASETDPETGTPYLGDILLSIPRAAEQASAIGHPLADEAQLLIVHGVLHLLGHDHAEAEEKEKMWQAQHEILETLGLGNIIIREE